MDRFTRNYSIILGLVVLGLLLWVFSEDPQVTELNELLDSDTGLAAYPYRFRVFRLQDGVATMGTPRSAEFPAFRALEILYPGLGGRDQDDPDLMAGQLEMARIQERARTLVLASGKVKQVRWELDSNWLTRHGISADTY